MQIRVSLGTVDPRLSPVLDAQRICTILTSNRINDVVTNFATDLRVVAYDESIFVLDIGMNHLKKKNKITQRPTTIIIDQDGTVVYRHKGYVPGDEVGILKAITELLDKKCIAYTDLELEKVKKTKKK